METNLPTPTTARVYVNLPEGRGYGGYVPSETPLKLRLCSLRNSVGISIDHFASVSAGFQVEIMLHATTGCCAAIPAHRSPSQA
jgi:hypothetical protein